jgi:[acyl-carrier-protein] S-malonyltransferase
LVISGSKSGIDVAVEKFTEAGARRAIVLPVGGAFHSPLMMPAQEQLAEAIEKTSFHTPNCPVYQNVSAKPETDPGIIKANLVAQLTGAVKWTQTMENMISDGVKSIIEVGGNGKVISGLFKKVDRKFPTSAL